MRCYFTLLFLSTIHLSFGQGPTLLDKSANPGETIMEFDNRTYEVKGSYYLFDDWLMGDIDLYTGTSIPDQWLNYNTANDMLEIKTEDQVKVVPLQKIYRFILKGQEEGDRTFIPCQYYVLEEEVPLVGMCEVIDSGYYGLLIKYSSDIKEATYVPAIDMGKKEEEIIINKKYYLSFGSNVSPIPRKKQLFISQYEPYKNELGSFMKEHKLNHKKEQDLRIILRYLNEQREKL